MQEFVVGSVRVVGFRNGKVEKVGWECRFGLLLFGFWWIVFLFLGSFNVFLQPVL